MSSRIDLDAVVPDTEPSVEHLLTAIQAFNDQSSVLRESYEQLRGQVRRLTSELNEKNEQLQHSLAEAERTGTHLNSILDSLDDAVVFSDLRGRITVFNRSAERISGYHAEEVLYRPLEALVCFGKQGTDLGTDTGHQVTEAILSAKSGRSIPVMWKQAEVRDRQNSLLGKVNVIVDRTEIQYLREMISQEASLSAMGEMVAQLAHEVRNPLGAVKGYAQLLAQRTSGKRDEIQTFISRLLEGVEEIDQMIQSVLAYARPPRRHQALVSIQDVMDDVLEHSETQAMSMGLELEITREQRDGQHLVMADPQDLKEIFLNLCVNGIEAMGNGGRLAAEVRGDRGAVVVSISDTGTGIEESIRKTIFEPFYTTKEKGTGLGLAIVRRLVDGYGGGIEVQSTPGSGTTFVVSLPTATPSDS